MKVLVVGSGLSAYGACIALLDKNKEIKLKIDVIDIGLNNPNQIKHDCEVFNSKDFKGSFFPYGINDSKNSFISRASLHLSFKNIFKLYLFALCIELF